MHLPIRALALGLAAAAAPCVLASLASAQTIYSDPLIGTAASDGSGYQSLAGTLPTISTTGAHWNAEYYSAPSLTTTGLDNWRYGNNLEYTATLPLTLDSQGMYTLSVNAVMPAGGYNAMDFGFLENYGTTNQDYAAHVPSAAAATFDINSSGTLRAAYAENTSSYATSYTLGSTHLFSIALDSTTGTLAFSLDGTVVDTITNALTATEMSNITSVALGAYYAPPAADFTNFSLVESTPTSPAPEPATTAMLVAGAAVLGLVARKRLAARVA